MLAYPLLSSANSFSKKSSDCCVICSIILNGLGVSLILNYLLYEVPIIKVSYLRLQSAGVQEIVYIVYRSTGSVCYCATVLY